MSVPMLDADTLGEAEVWTVLRGLAERAASGRPICERTGLRLTPHGTLETVRPEQSWLCLMPGQSPHFLAAAPIAPEAAWLLDVYLPLCVGADASHLVLAHLGQSLDGQIATASGASRYVTGQQNLEHVHRLRALFDAVVVGATTVLRDDPQLTTRLVPGHSPARVVIDPGARTPSHSRVFTDSSVPTFLICARGALVREHRRSHVHVLELDAPDGRIAPHSVVAALGDLGLRRLFVEGGGLTVSSFLVAKVVHRLQLTISPIFLGVGRPALMLPPLERMDQALRPKTRRIELGEDVLFDCQLEREERAG